MHTLLGAALAATESALGSDQRPCIADPANPASFKVHLFSVRGVEFAGRGQPEPAVLVALSSVFLKDRSPHCLGVGGRRPIYVSGFESVEGAKSTVGARQFVAGGVHQAPCLSSEFQVALPDSPPDGIGEAVGDKWMPVVASVGKVLSFSAICGRVGPRLAPAKRSRDAPKTGVVVAESSVGNTLIGRVYCVTIPLRIIPIGVPGSWNA